MDTWEDYGSSCALCKLKPPFKDHLPIQRTWTALVECKDLSKKTKGIQGRSISLSHAMDEDRGRSLKQQMFSKVSCF